MKLSKTIKIDFEICFQNWYLIPTFFIHTELQEIGFEFLCFGLYISLLKEKSQIEKIFYEPGKHTGKHVMIYGTGGKQPIN